MFFLMPVELILFLKPVELMFFLKRVELMFFLKPVKLLLTCQLLVVFQLNLFNLNAR